MDSSGEVALWTEGADGERALGKDFRRTQTPSK